MKLWCNYKIKKYEKQINYVKKAFLYAVMVYLFVYQHYKLRLLL